MRPGLPLIGIVWAVLLGLDLGCGPGTPAPASSAQIRSALSLPQFRAASMAPRVEQSWRRRDAVIERVVFQGRWGQPIPALVAYSDMAAARPLPVILCMPGSPNRKEDLMRPLDLLSLWAQEGFFVISIDRPYHGDRPGDPEQAIRDKGLPRVLGEYVYDLMRALDYSATRPEADMSRVGMLGLSMGGMEALLLAAVDERVGCVASVSGQLSWLDVFTTDSWKLIFTGLPLTDRLRAAGASGTAVYEAFLQQMPELAVLDAPAVSPSLAPRPLLLMTGDGDPYVTTAATMRTYAAAVGAYRSNPEKLQVWIDPGVGHAFSTAMQGRALDWFRLWLLGDQPRSR
ncbi:MAG: alpha/beta fold hydrolase [Gemmatimonadetes bacterium]|nr:alpha/beta fold hydrolase [Gemmatimonadota bacterium]